MKSVLFACVHNAGRSQMASAFFNAMADPGLASGVSAGTEPADRLHPEVVAVMAEAGFDLSPVVPGLRVVDWAIEDPKGRDAPAVRRIRDEIRERVRSLVVSEGWGEA